MFGRLYRFVMEDLDPDGHVKTENAKAFGKLLEFTRPGPDVAGMHAVTVHQQEVARPGGRAGIPVTQTTPALFDACASSGR